MKSRTAPTAKQAGFTLVELMIALTLGLLIVSAIGAIFVSSKRSFRTGEGVSQVQEEGRFSTSMLTAVVRQAGYLPDPAFTQLVPADIFQSALNKLLIFGVDSITATGSTYPYTVINSGGDANKLRAGTDVLAITYVGRNTAGGVGVAADSPMRTCLGDAVTDTQMAVNIFYINNSDTATTGVPTLYCYTSISTLAGAAGSGTVRDEPLVAGITDLQVLYGIDTDSPPDGAANRYVAANASTMDWTRVVSVQLAVTADSADAVERTMTNTTSTTNGISGGRIRRTFVTTVNIRNRY